MSQKLGIMENKICFIICSNNSLFLDECLLYISRLEIPLGYEVETISIRDAKSMTSGFNEGMMATNAKYKVYLHQDVFIVYKNFLQSILDIFHSDPMIGMIGMVGSLKIPVDGVMWHGYRAGALYSSTPNKKEYDSYMYQVEDGLYEVDAVDGCMMITSMDIPWREDIFEGWDFYDVSQCLEFKNRGYKVVVPHQDCAWCKHDDGVLNFVNYDKYRKKCIDEYREYFYPERFKIQNIKNKQQSKNKNNVSIVLIVRDQFKQLKTVLESIKLYSKVNNNQIIIVDNGSRDGIHNWLNEQKEYNYIICGEVIEGYSAILNEVCKQFVEDESLLVMTPDFVLLPGCINRLDNILESDSQIGAVYGNVLEQSHESYEEVVEKYLSYKDKEQVKETLGIPWQGVLIANRMLKQLQFDEELGLPQNVMMDFAFQGKLRDFKYYHIINECFCQLSSSLHSYIEILNEEKEQRIIKKKWGMNYFNTLPNYLLISYIERQNNECFSVLEIGCDCGANLLEIQNNYPGAMTYGVEINPTAASIASHISKVKIANIEEQTLDLDGNKFDYIIFGDVLEHLRDPKACVEYCRSLLKKDGKIIASVPNLMHFSVLQQLLNGNFTYTDTGLLDKTHIHFFTYNEMIRMFIQAGYRVEKICNTYCENITAEEAKFVNNLKAISENAQEFMFMSVQYVIRVVLE